MKADLILESNLIFDSVSDTPFAGFVAVKDNKILYVSKDMALKADYIAPDTKVMKYQDKLIMPAFFDAHVHLISGGLSKTFMDLGHLSSEEETAKYCYEFAQNNSFEGWLIGYNWFHFRWDNPVMPHKKSLDKYFKDIPVMLCIGDGHSIWVNSKALELAGITNDTPNPEGGEIERDENGEATGILYEQAEAFCLELAYDFSLSQEKILVKNFEKAALAYGITSIIDVKPMHGRDLGSIDLLKELEANDDLNMRIHCATDLFGDLDKAYEDSKKYHSDKVRSNLLKQFIDGVFPTHTALMIEEYADKAGNCGYPMNPPELFEDAISKAHKLGMSVKIHAIGDYAAHFILDCYEKALLKHGPTQSRHAIEHCELVDDADIVRFGKLGVIPSVQPEHLGMADTWDSEPYRVVLGEERAGKTWSFKKLLDSAGVLALGSDCPVVDNNPFHEIHRGLTRLHDDLLPEEGWNPTQKLTLPEILKSYTYGSAYSASREDELGTLEVGKFADIVVVDRDLFTVSPAEIRKASVLVTVMDGKVVYQK